MEEVGPFLSTKRYAVVSGANKGIGFEICKQLASNGVVVVLTARDQNKGLEAVEQLKNANSGFSDFVIFHQLDVTDPNSIASLALFLNTHFGKLDILVNNAAIGGLIVEDFDALKPAVVSGKSFDEINWNEISSTTHEMLEECLKTNYYGAKAMVEALMPLLQLSDSARVVNVSSFMGRLKYIPNEWAKGVFNDGENLTEEKIDEVLSHVRKYSREGSLENKGWGGSGCLTAYNVSKAAMNAYTRVMAKKYPCICISSVCPGFCKTDINCNTGKLSAEEGASSPVKLALMPHGSPSGLFFLCQQVSTFQ